MYLPLTSAFDMGHHRFEVSPLRRAVKRTATSSPDTGSILCGRGAWAGGIGWPVAFRVPGRTQRSV